MGVYINDNNGFYAWHFSSSFTFSDTSVFERLEPYGPKQPGQDTAKPKGLWICPSDWAPKTFGSTKVLPISWWHWVFCYVDQAASASLPFSVFKYTSYAYHINPYSPSDGGDSLPYGLYGYRTGNSRKASKIRMPTGVVMFACGSASRANTYYDISNDQGMAYDPLHNQWSKKAVNIVACDGHSETVTDLRYEPDYDWFGDLFDYWILPNSWYIVK